MTDVFRSRYKIIETTHPHYGETGTWEGEVIPSTGQWVLQLENCPHWNERAAAMRGELQSLPS